MSSNLSYIIAFIDNNIIKSVLGRVCNTLSSSTDIIMFLDLTSLGGCNTLY